MELDRILTQLAKRLRERKPHAQPETALETGQEKNAAENDVVQAVKDYVRVHIRDTIYIGDIAASVFLNEQHLMRIFKRETGVSVLEYITGERLAVSKRLLITTALPVNQVALQAGYENYSYFIRLFKRNFGVTPQVYRQNGGITNE
jgi:two-component system response regulator YesN